MDTIIYRKSDKLIAGYVFPRRTEEQTQEAVLTEFANILQSELGGVPNDYAQVEVEQSRQPGLQVVINADGSVSFIPITPDPRRARLAELVAISRSTWTTAQLRELLQLTAEELMD